MQLTLKQVADVANELLLRKTTAPGGGTIAQVVLGQKTFTEGTETDRTSEAPSTPGRFDSSSSIAALALFGAEGVGDLTAGAGFWGGPSAPTGSIWWVPDNPFNQDYGHFTLRQSRGSQGFDPVSNSAVLTGPAGIEAYYLQVPMGRTTASPGTSPANYISDTAALWPPSEVGYAKLFSRPGPSPYFDYANREPGLAITSRDLSGVVRTETLLTIEKAALIFTSPIGFSPGGTYVTQASLDAQLSTYLQSPDLPPGSAPLSPTSPTYVIAAASPALGPYVLWADTASGQLRQRNAADTGWVTLGLLASSAVGGLYDRTSSFTVDQPGMYTVYASPSPVVVTLPPTATSDGWVVDIKKIDQSGNSITVQVDSSPELIDFVTSTELTTGGDNLTVRCDAAKTTWWVK